MLAVGRVYFARWCARSRPLCRGQRWRRRHAPPTIVHHLVDYVAKNEQAGTTIVMANGLRAAPAFLERAEELGICW